MSPRCYYQGSGFFACAHAKTLGQDDLLLLRLFLLKRQGVSNQL
jgi:hypothetical protein